ncbi:hypothetical protein J2T13_003039 [Paenibacillus sp. DS2015]|uniref:hypothetical protein n=1 Tax=Paenibacillus sp. DS2015 TaxID=3373917 RepID=UPI003D19D8B8
MVRQSQTGPELLLVKKYLELPILLDVLEYDKQRVINSSMSLRKWFSEYLDSVQNQVSKDLHIVKNELISKDMRIIAQSRTADRLIAQYRCRGYQQQIEMLWSKVKYDSEVMLVEYLTASTL